MDAWEFWIDRGGTFTDIVARSPKGDIQVSKLLSENPQRYEDAALEGIRRLLGLGADDKIPLARVKAVKMGTTVATNALLERQGAKTVLVTTQGLGDQLRIAYQNRPDAQLFARHLQPPAQLYEQVIEAQERVSAQGVTLTPLNEEHLRGALDRSKAKGAEACAIVFAHAYRYKAHEARAAQIAKEAGFKQISVSHEVSALMKMVGRGDTTVADAYLSPVLRRYIDRVARAFDADPSGVVMFMMSSGGLTDAKFFRGKDAILSGPAGGVVGGAKTAQIAKLPAVLGFDMGGTSTDVWRFEDDFERAFDTQVAGVRIRAPMMRIHTVAAGGGSKLSYQNGRLQVGPESAGADPGPACYGRGGPLAVTDANVMLGRLRPEFFPAIFGPNADQQLSKPAVEAKFAALAAQVGQPAEELAEGFLRIAVESMATAIKKISVERGYDAAAHALSVFGGAGAQHACLVADALGVETCLIHPLASVLSAYGMGLAELREARQQALEAPLTKEGLTQAAQLAENLANQARGALALQGADEISLIQTLHLKLEGTDTALPTPMACLAELRAAFAQAHQARYGFAPDDRALIIEAVAVEAVASGEEINEPDHPIAPRPEETIPTALRAPFYSGGAWRAARFVRREDMRPGDALSGPAVVVEPHTAIVVEPGWRAHITAKDHVTLRRAEPKPQRVLVSEKPDPAMLEVFNNLFMSVAEQMGAVLANTASSVTIKERLDFSCAVFTAQGDLIANAPHMPVHLGSMNASVKTVIKANQQIQEGDAFALNAPYNGGTHLPDVTVVSPVFHEGEIIFFTAARGHHTDVGGSTPGSMPPDSKTIHDEGVYIDNAKIVAQGVFLEEQTRKLFEAGPHPARRVDLNLADLKAQLAACAKGAAELARMITLYGPAGAKAYTRHVQNNAENCVRDAIGALKDGAYVYPMDDGPNGEKREIRVAIKVDAATKTARIDFTGTSPQSAYNFNAPEPVARAAVLYAFRCLVDAPIPMNEGVMKPLEIILPEGSLLSPRHPAAVIAGNVETSQAVVNALFLALGVKAAAQGTMNNTTWGDATRQYYETLCGGDGAGRLSNGEGYAGASAIHTHMTNSRLTDPEVLEWRFPVLLEEFRLRAGSGGEGTFKGGEGVTRKVKFLEPMDAAILSGHRTIPPPGLEAGGPGALGRTYVVRANGDHEELRAADKRSLRPGDALVVQTPGGGGYTPSTEQSKRESE